MAHPSRGNNNNRNTGTVDLLGLSRAPADSQELLPDHDDRRGPGAYDGTGARRFQRQQQQQQQQYGDPFWGQWMPPCGGGSPCRCLFVGIICCLAVLLVLGVWSWITATALNTNGQPFQGDRPRQQRSNTRDDNEITDGDGNRRGDDGSGGRRTGKRPPPDENDGGGKRPSRGGPVPVSGPPRPDRGSSEQQQPQDDVWRAAERAQETARKDFPQDGNVRPHDAHEVEMVEHHAVFNLPRKMDIIKMYPEGEGLEATRGGAGVDGLRLVCMDVTDSREEEYPGSRHLEVKRHRDKQDKGLYIEVKFSDAALESAKCTLYYTVQRRVVK